MKELGLKVVEMSKKIKKRLQEWYDPGIKRNEDYVGMIVLETNILGRKEGQGEDGEIR